MPADKYASLADLTAALGTSVYRIRALDRRSPVTITSVHGGQIEKGTSAIARAIAGRNYNLFDFQGLKRDHPPELHVTATRFRHPTLTRLLHASSFAVSIHGMGNTGNQTIWLGGLNAQLKQLTLAELQSAGFSVEPDSPKYRGESPRNIVNLPRLHGVQLELPLELTNTMFCGPAFLQNGRKPPTNQLFDAFTAAICKAVRRFLTDSKTSKCA
jgi:phage replication-related protein YjqB (UPF0714/DUF867 family)